MPNKYDTILDEYRQDDTTSPDAVYLLLTGGTVTGDVSFPLTGIIVSDVNGVRWRMTLDETGAWVSTLADVIGEPGFPFGLTLGATFIS